MDFLFFGIPGGGSAGVDEAGVAVLREGVGGRDRVTANVFW